MADIYPHTDRSAVMEVDRILKLLKAIGTWTGCRLLCFGDDRSSKSIAWQRLFRYGAFFGSISFYLMSVVCLIFSITPLPSEVDAELRLNSMTIYSIADACFILDQLMCFVSLNYAHAVLNRPGGFYDQNRLLLARLPADRVRRWRRFVLFTVVFTCICGFISTVITSIYVSDLVENSFPINFSRVTVWMHTPDTFERVLAVWVTIIGMSHAISNVIVFASNCELTRMHFTSYCQRLESETADSFSDAKVSEYHSEYARLASLAERLDVAFRHSCFSQLFLFVSTVCMYLFCLIQEANSLALALGLAYWILVISFVFAYFAVPAILLRSEAEQPKKLLRLWQIKHEQACEEKGSAMDEVGRRAVAFLTHWITSENVGLTVSSLAKFDAPMLLSIASVVITYLLVIMQFASPISIDLSILHDRANRSNHSELCEKLCLS